MSPNLELALQKLGVNWNLMNVLPCWLSVMKRPGLNTDELYFLSEGHLHYRSCEMQDEYNYS